MVLLRARRDRATPPGTRQAKRRRTQPDRLLSLPHEVVALIVRFSSESQPIKLAEDEVCFDERRLDHKLADGSLISTLMNQLLCLFFDVIN
jgi:hypothetical protein